MDLFQIMCANGCGKEPDEWVKVLSKILSLSTWIIPLLIIVFAIYKLAKDIKKNKKKAYIEFIKRIIFAIVIFLIISLIHVLILINIPREYDEVLQCWCS